MVHKFPRLSGWRMAYNVITAFCLGYTMFSIYQGIMWTKNNWKAINTAMSLVKEQPEVLEALKVEKTITVK